MSLGNDVKLKAFVTGPMPSVRVEKSRVCGAKRKKDENEEAVSVIGRSQITIVCTLYS